MTLALATDATTVTRIEIADHVETAFAAGPATRDDLLAAARTAGARPALLAVLGDLPDRPYAELRQLWTDLPEVPITR
jgi:hypothetical protein